MPDPQPEPGQDRQPPDPPITDEMLFGTNRSDALKTAGIMVIPYGCAFHSGYMKAMKDVMAFMLFLAVAYSVYARWSRKNGSN